MGLGEGQELNQIEPDDGLGTSAKRSPPQVLAAPSGTADPRHGKWSKTGH